MLWLIDLTVAACHIQYTKHENTLGLPFSYDTKMAANGYWACKALILRASFKAQDYGKVRLKCL